MAISEAYSGTQSATVGTEHTLNTTTPETTDGIYQFWVSLGNLADGDELEISIKEKVISGATQRLVWFASYKNAVNVKVAVTPTIILLHGWDFTLKQVAGTGRDFAYSVRKVA